MKSVEFVTGDAWNPYVETGEKREGLLGKLGMGETEDVLTLTCPECGLLRFYADPDDEEPH
ncbi:MAG: hypothetical protein ABEJ26_01125 [Halosimplex sp.]